MSTITVSRNTYEWKKELKAWGFQYNPATKSWTGDPDKITLSFQRDAILALCDPIIKSTGSMATRNGPGCNEIDNLYI